MDGSSFPPGRPKPLAGPRWDTVQHLYTVNPNSPPPANTLLVGELGLELATPAKIWVGVPTSMDPTGRKLLIDSGDTGGASFPEAPADAKVYGRQGTVQDWLEVLPITGGTLVGGLTIRTDVDVNNLTILATGAGWPGVKWNTTQATSAAGYFESQRYGLPRWGMEFGGTQNESGFNNGTDFLLNRFSDLGAILSPAPLAIKRSTGAITVATSLLLTYTISAAQHAVNKAYTDATYAPIVSGGYLPISGGSLTGGLGFGGVFAAAVTDMSRHITLHTSGYGFGITSNRFNYNANVAGAHVFITGTQDRLTIGASNIQVGTGVWITLYADPTAPLHAATKQWVESKTGDYLPLSGGILTGGLGFGQSVVLTTTDLSRHISLHNSGYGFGITANRLNYNAPPNATHWFMSGTADIMRITSVGVTMGSGFDLQLDHGPTSDLHAATKKYVDDKTIAITGSYLPLAGGTMSGALTLFGPPSLPLHATTKTYVDTADALKLNLTGGVLTGQLTMSAGFDILLARAPTLDLHAATKVYVDAVASAQGNYLLKSGGTMTGPLILNADPGANLGAATKQYVDAVKSFVIAGYLPLTGGALTGGLGFGSSVVLTTTDITRHISLHASSNVGFGITANRLNYNLPVNFSHVFMAAAVDIVTITSFGLNMQPNTDLALARDPSAPLYAATKQYVDNKAATITGSYLALAGGTMLGDLTLFRNGFNPLHAVTLQQLNAGLGLYLPLAGGILTGDLTLFRNASGALHAIPLQQLNAAIALYLPLAGGTVSGPLFLGTTPTANAHAATKLYVDNAVATTVGVYLPLAGGVLTGRVQSNSPFTINWSAGVMNRTHGFWDTVNAAGFGIFASAASTLGIGGTDLNGIATSTWIRFNNLGDILPLAGGTLKLGSINSTTAAVVGGIEMYAGLGGFGVSTGNVLNYNWAGVHQFAQGSTLVMQIASGNLTMQGSLFLKADPAGNLEAATKQYVDSKAGAYLPLAGGNLTGPLTINSTGFAWTGAVAGDQVRQTIVWTGAGTLAGHWIVSAGGAEPSLVGVAAQGSMASQVAVLNSQTLLRLVGRGHDGTAWSDDQAAIMLRANETWAAGKHGTFILFALTPKGSTTRSPAGLINGSGNWMLGSSDPALDNLVDRLQVIGSASFTGAITLPSDPTANLHAATKQYVDNKIVAGGFLPLAGGIMTGGISFGALVGATTVDLSKHITLHNTGHGFSVTTSRLNYNVPGGASAHWFIYNGVDKLNIGSTGLTMAASTDIILNRDASSALHATTKQQMDAGLALKLNLTGGTMTGSIIMTGAVDITLAKDPSAIMHAVTRQYADNALALKLNLAGGTLTGPLILAADPSAALGAATKQYVDTKIGAFLPLAGGTMTGGIIFANALGTVPGDVSKHITLYSGMGIGVTANRVNYLAPVGGTHVFMVSTDVATINNTGLVMAASTDITLSRNPTGALMAVPKQYADLMLPLAGGAMTGGISFGSAVVAGPTVLTRHLALYGTVFGFSITTARLNIVAPDTSATWFNAGTSGTDIAYFNTTGLNMVGLTTVVLGKQPTANMHAATKQYVDGIIASSGGPFLPITAGPSQALTGQLYLPHVTPTVDEMATAKFYVDAADQNLQSQISAVVSGNLVFYGQLDVANDVVQYKYTINIPNSPMPPPTSVPKGGYIIVTVGGIPPATGSNIPPLPLGTPQYVRGDWFISDGDMWIFLPTGLVYFTADAVEVTPPIQGTTNVQATLNWLNTNKLNLAGGTMTGSLVLQSDPTSNLMAATRQYVDARPFLPLAGGTMTGGISFGILVGASASDLSKHITLHTNGYGFGVTSGRLNYNASSGAAHRFRIAAVDVASIGATGLTMLGTTDIILARDPSSALQATTKQYVDGRTPIASDAPNDTSTYGRRALAWSRAESVTLVGAGAFDLNTVPAGYIGSYQFTNQTAAANWPVGIYAQSGYLLTGYGTTTGWSGQLLMGPPANATTDASLWYRSQFGGTWSPWWRIVTTLGGTFTGSVILKGDPSTALEAATKQYVDAVTTAQGNYLLKAGGTMTGNLMANPASAIVPVTIAGNMNNMVLTSVFGMHLGFNHSAGQAEADFINSYAAAVQSFRWYQVTGPGTQTVLMTLLPTGALSLAGPLTLPADPTALLHAATKQYVDSVRTLVTGSYLPLAGGTMSGLLVLSADPSGVLGAATKQYVDTRDALDLHLTGGTLSGGLGFGSSVVAGNTDITRHISLYGTTYGIGVTSNRINYVIGLNGVHWFLVNAVDILKIDNTGLTINTGTITLLGDPTALMHAATKQYVDTKFAAGVVSFNLRTGPVTLNNADVIAVLPSSATNPVMNGAVAPGSSTAWSRGDHIHPSDTSRLALTGGTLSGGLSFGSAVAASTTDLTRHINLYGGVYGFSITGGRQNYVASNHVFVVGTTDIAQVASSGLWILSGNLVLAADPTSAMHAATKQYVDKVQPSFTRIATDSAFDLNTISGSGAAGPFTSYQGFHSIFNQTAGLNFPPGITTASVLNLWSSTSGLTTQLAMHNAGMSYRWMTSTGVYNAWTSVMLSSGAAMTGGLSFGSRGAASATDVTQHLALYGTSNGISITGFRQNYVVAASNSHVFVINAIDTVTIASTGLTMAATTDITLARDPTAVMHAATKQYVDARVGGSGYLPTVGGTMTGPLTMTASSAINLQAVSTTTGIIDSDANYGMLLQGLAGAVADVGIISRVGGATAQIKISSTGLVIINGVQVDTAGVTTLVSDPTAALHAVTKQYVDTKVAGGVTRFNNRTGDVVLLNADVIGVLPSYATVPAMNGTASAGASGAWTRGDHVHPSDTTRVAKAGDTMTGNLKISVADSALGLLVNGVTKGARFVASAGGFTIEGVDNTGVGSYQPLTLSGSSITLGQNTTLAAGKTLTLAQDPTAVLHAATKQYVDAADTARVLKAGDTMSGDLTMSSARKVNFQAVLATTGSINSDANYGVLIQGLAGAASDVGISSRIAGPAELRVFSTGSIYLNGATVDNLGTMLLVADPTTGLGAATKQYVDTKTGGGVTRFNTRTGDVVMILTDVTDVLPASAALPAMNGTAYAGSNVTWSRGDHVHPSDTTRLPLTGGSMVGGINFGAAVAASNTDLTRHLSLHTGGYGFNVMAFRTNYNVPNLAAHWFLVNGVDIATVNSTGIVMAAATDITLVRDPTANLQAVTKQYVDTKVGLYVPISGGTMTGNLIMSASNRLFLSGGSYAIYFTGVDSWGLGANNLAISSWFGIGLQNSVGGQTIPSGLFGAYWNTRTGDQQILGDLAVRNSRDNAVSQIQNIRIWRSSTDQIIDIASVVTTASMTSNTPVAGGSGLVLNERLYDAYGNTYTATAVTGGVATTVIMNTATARNGNVPANPIALTAAPGFVGIGVTVNLTWTAPTRLVLATGANQSLYLNSVVGTTVNGATGSWGSFNYGKQLLVTGNSTNPAIGIADNSGGNWVAIINSAGKMMFADMPSIVDSTTAPTHLLQLDVSSCIAYRDFTFNGKVTLSADPSANLEAATKQYVDTKVSTGVGAYLPLTGGTLTGPLLTSYTATATTAQIFIRPVGNANSLESKLRFGGTFASGTDYGARLTASLRSGYSAGAWGGEYLDVWMNNGGANDSSTDASQLQIARFTRAGIAINGVAATARGLVFTTAGSRRWEIRANATAESTGNVGSDLDIFNFDDTSTAIANPLVRITRSTGQVTINAGLSLGSVASALPNTLTRHLMLYSTSYGLSVTSNTLNIVTGGTTIQFLTGATVLGTLTATGLAMGASTDITLVRDPTAALHAATKQYCDNKFALAVGGGYVAKTGDTMSGALIVGSAVGNVQLNQGNATQTGYVSFFNQAAVRQGYFGYASGGALQLVLEAGTSQLSLTGNFSINGWGGGYASLELRKGGSGQGNQILGYTGSGASLRWNLQMGDGTAEAAGNDGSHFAIHRYDNSGNYVGNPLHINRANGTVTIANTLSMGGEIWSQNGIIRVNPAGTAYIFYNNSNSTFYLQATNGLVLTGAPISMQGTVNFNGLVNIAGLTATNSHIVIQAPGGAFASYNSSSAYCGGMWVAGAGGVQFGQCNSSGGPTVTHAFISASSFGTVAWDCSFACNNGANSLCYGNGSQFIVPSAAYKPGGGAWADGSDARIKDVLADYKTGLEAILALRPVWFRYKNNWSRDGDVEKERHREVVGKEYIGLVAQEAEIPMPEMVSSITAKLDNIEVNDLRILDMTALPLALVNAIKELVTMNAALSERVAALETRTLH